MVWGRGIYSPFQFYIKMVVIKNKFRVHSIREKRITLNSRILRRLSKQINKVGCCQFWQRKVELYFYAIIQAEIFKK